MRESHFRAGMSFFIAPFEYRVVPGKKDPNDLVLEVLKAGTWHKVTMDHAFLYADFFYENEEVLYPPPYRGGHYFLRRLKDAAVLGWRHEAQRLKDQKQAKREREKV
jgi:hypothetical protein